MRTRLLSCVATLGAMAAVVPSAVAAQADASAITALLPGGKQGSANASLAAGTGQDQVSAGGLRPSGGGTIADLSATARVEEGGDGAGRASGTVIARGLSLFEGRVTIDSLEVAASVRAELSGRSGQLDSARVSGLVVNGVAQQAEPGARIAVEGIGTLIFFERADNAAGMTVNALRVEVTDPDAASVIGTPFVIGHLDLSAEADPPPAPTTAPATPTSPPATAPTPTDSRTATGPAATAPARTTATAPRGATRPKVATVPRPTTAGPVRRPGPATPAPAPTTPAPAAPIFTPNPAPLTPLPRREAPAVTAPLGDGHVFPVVGEVGFSDDYGAPRAGTGSHYGNDLFAPTGTPLVAVADGILSKVGVNTLGGNRLWLTDGDGVAFYYAHLSAYAPVAVEGARVTRGQVIGFVGNTGQAITTPPHLHFEIHPGGIDAPALNPYPYLIAWQAGEGRAPVALADDGRSAGHDATTAGPAAGAVLVDVEPERDLPEAAPGGSARGAR